VTALENCKFHFDRIRMIVKDLHLQKSTEGGNVSSSCIEILEYICRFLVDHQHRLNMDECFLNHYAVHNEDFLISTLMSLMSLMRCDAHCRRTGFVHLCNNEREFVAYAIMVLRAVPSTHKELEQDDPLMRSSEVLFALQVLKTMESSAGADCQGFFRMYAVAPHLAACCMVGYVEGMRRIYVDYADTADHHGNASSASFDSLREPLGLAAVEDVQEWLMHDDPKTEMTSMEGVGRWLLTGRRRPRARVRVPL
jgi:hypothetical protein